MGDLAMLGGAPAVPPGSRDIAWPIITAEDEAAMLRVVRGGKLVATAEGEGEIPALEAAWAQQVGVSHCVAVSDGTAALSIALSALGIGEGDEVLVPALTFVASGLAVLHAGATPVFVDVDPVTFTIDAADLAAKVTPRSAAVMPVHLHGHVADMEAIDRIAASRGLAVVEDAAQAHGSVYHGRAAGALGRAAGFSLNATKNLPTCGEGGLITTDDAGVADRARLLRQFGEAATSRTRDYISYALGSNHKLNPVQAAFTNEQLRRFGDYERARQCNMQAFLAAIEGLPGLVSPTVAPGTTHAWHILRFRLDPAAAGIPDVSAASLRQALHRVLRAEGVPVSRYQVVPLPAQDVFRCGATVGRPLPADVGKADRAWSREAFPTTSAIIDDSLTLQRRHLNPDAGPLLMRYAEGLHKVWDNLETVALLARANEGRNAQ